MRIVVGKILQLVTGGLLGCILGGIITHNEIYWIALAIGVPLLLTFAGIFGAGAVKARRASGEPVLRPGIISTIPGMRPTPLREAVLNPVSTAQPSSGVVLNGEVVGAPETTTPVVTPAGSDPVPKLPLWWKLLSILTMLAGAALVLLPSAQVIGWVASDIAQGRPFDGRDMTTGLHQQEAFDEIVDVMGGTDVVSITFFDDYIAVSAPTTPGARTVDRFIWKDGYAANSGPDFSQPSDLDEALFDAGDIDMSVVADVVRQSIADAKLEGLDGVYPRIARFSDEPPDIGVALSGAYFDAYYSYSLTGELLDRGGSLFD